MHFDLIDEVAIHKISIFLSYNSNRFHDAVLNGQLILQPRAQDLSSSVPPSRHVAGKREILGTRVVCPRTC